MSDTKTTPKTEDLSSFARDWLRGKRAEDFEVIEHLGGTILWPITLIRVRAAEGGKPGRMIRTEEKAYLQVLTPIDRMQALQEATEFFDEKGFKVDDPRHRAFWEQIEMTSRVVFSLREHEPMADGTRARKHTLRDIFDRKACGISEAEIARIDDMLLQFGKFESSKLERMDKELAINVALAVAEVRNCTPLAAIAASEQDTCVVYICDLLASYLTPSARSGPS